MEILLELLLEIFGQVVLEFLADLLGRGLGRLLSTRVARVLLGTAAAVAVGFGGGYWWGARLTELGRTDPPKSLWVSIGLAVLFLALAVVRSRRTETESGRAPWRWSAGRLLGFSVLNAAAAAGIATGFTPRPLR